MPLEISRPAVENALKASEPPTQETMLSLIDTWWRDYKAWEAQDKFLVAFKEGRMTIRQAPESLAYDDTSVAAFSAGNIKFGSAYRDPYPGQAYSVGMDSLKQRLEPKSFNLTAKGERGKYALGLHDLSGSLLDPVKPKILDQLRWKNEGKKLEDWISIFMPMAKEEDMVLFYLLNDMSKKVKNQSPKIYDAVVAIRRSMSRLKLGASEDIASGLFDISPNPHVDSPKFRYGLKAKPGEDPMKLQENQDRIRTVLHYKGIVKLQREKQSECNEIVIAYRQHAGDRFPLYTKWKQAAEPVADTKPKPVVVMPTGGGPPPPPPPMPDKVTKQRSEGEFVCLGGEPSSKYILGGAIPNKWEDTQELN